MDPLSLLLLLGAFLTTLWVLTFHLPLNEALEAAVHGALRLVGIERPHSPVQALRGARGRLERPFHGDPPAARVRVRGESWRARCAAPPAPEHNRAGASVVVVGGRGNLLLVELDGPPDG
jgi:membrane protein implicated in regulation of membrane protease activity